MKYDWSKERIESVITDCWGNYALARKYKSYKKYSKATRDFLKYLFLHNQ